MKFTIEKISNMIFVVSEVGTVWRTWDETKFTERKLKNAMNQISKRYCGNAEFIRTF